MAAQPRQLQGLPVLDFLEPSPRLRPEKRKAPITTKHSKAYLAFCKWSATPRDLRQPKTQLSFERKWHLPANYTQHWKEREDFQARRITYFWNWMFDRFPDVVYAIYRRAKRNSSTDAKIFADLIGKRLETEQPKVEMRPLILMGVPQERLDALFIPKAYDNAVQQTVSGMKAKVEEAEVVEESKEEIELEQL